MAKLSFPSGMCSGLTRRDFLKGLAAGGALSLLPNFSSQFAQAAIPERSNVLLLLSDQHRADGMGVVDPSYVTPSMDRLSSSGVRFTNCFCTAPLCCPARSSLMTGRWPQQTSVVSGNPALPEKERTIGEVFGRRGYQTAYFGKWHLGGSPADHGFQTAGAEPLPGTIGQMTGASLRWLRRHRDPSLPFFLVVSWVWPHQPWQLVEQYADLFPLDGIPIPGNFHDSLADKPSWYLENYQHKKVSESGVRIIGQMYRTMVRRVDDWVGALTNALVELDIADRTVVAYTSDHGELLGAHGMRGKFLPFDEAARIPFLLHVPGMIPTRAVVNDLVSQVSIPGTLLEAAGLAIPPSFVGGSFLSRAMTDGPPAEEAVFYSLPPYRAVRTREWKFTIHDGYVNELYDLVNDPLELTNLAGRIDYRPVRRDLRQQIETWWPSTGGGNPHWTVP